MPKGLESKLEKDLRLFAESLGGMFPKSVSPGKKGWPDRNPSHWVCGPFYMEVKRPGEESTPLQMKVSREMAANGYRVYASVNQFRIGKEIIEDEFNGVPPRLRRHQPVRAYE